MKRQLCTLMVFALMFATLLLPVTAQAREADTWGSGAWESPVCIATAQLRLNSDYNALNNIELAADSIYDCTLMTNDVFSFNDVVGPRSVQYGYSDAIDSRGEIVTGGGTEEVASLLWLAIKGLDCVSISEKATYGEHYVQDYVLLSSDAILVDNFTDFAFRYTGEGCITIYTYIEANEQNESLRCDIYQYQ